MTLVVNKKSRNQLEKGHVNNCILIIEYLIIIKSKAIHTTAKPIYKCHYMHMAQVTQPHATVEK